MNVESALSNQRSKANVLQICDYIGTDRKRFSQLADIFFNGSKKNSEHAAWVIGKYGEMHPEMLNPYEKQFWENLKKPVPAAIKRNTLRVYQFITISPEILGTATDICFKAILSPDEPVAVKVFAMSILLNIVKKEPDLARELQIVIEEQLPYQSAAFKSRGKKVMKELGKITA